MKRSLLLLTVLFILAPAYAASTANKQASCPDYLNHSYRILHSNKDINLCKLYQGKPILIVNTASHCGYTKQFTGLETLFQRYKDQGLQVIGFASNDFKQEAKNEAEAAGICYKNYGVTFTMLAPQAVKGEQANATFQALNKASKAPNWNFNKYVISANGSEITHYPSKITPTDSKLESHIKTLLAKP